MNRIITSLVSLLLVLTATLSTMAIAQENTEEAIESKCIIEAEDKGITDDKFDDYVSKCIESAKENN